MKKLVALILLISSPVFGDVNVQYLTKGTPAGFDGYLFTPSMEQSFRLTDAQLDYQKQINAELTSVNLSYQDEVSVANERINNQQAEIKELNAKVNPFFGKEFYFVLGAVLSGLIGYSVYRTK
jgi:hypothetical protein